MGIDCEVNEDVVVLFFQMFMKQLNCLTQEMLSSKSILLRCFEIALGRYPLYNYNLCSILLQSLRRLIPTALIFHASVLGT